MAVENVEDYQLEGDVYPDGKSMKPKIYPQYFLADASEPEVGDLLCAELTQEEIKAAFRLFDDTGEGFITTTRFRVSFLY